MTLWRKTFFSRWFYIILMYGLLSFVLVTKRSSDPTEFTRHYLSNIFGGGDSKCLDEWHDLELFLTTPASADGEREIVDVFLPSLSLFWPQRHIKLVIITDNETEGVDEFCQRVRDACRRAANFESRCVKTVRAFESNGWHRSQWIKFWADNFTTSEFVGVVDTDTMFVTRVALSDLFIDGRPIVRPLFGPPSSLNVWYWGKVPAITLNYTGFEEPFNCMTYFPVIIKRSHIAHFREQIVRTAGKGTFDEIFATAVATEHESEYNMMCAMMWNMFRNDYHWIMEEVKPGWKSNVPGQVRSLADAGVSLDMVRPYPMTNIHWTYHTAFPDFTKNVFRAGVCYSMTDSEARPSYCGNAEHRTEVVNSWEFFFQEVDFSSRPGALEAHRERLSRIDKCPHKWNQSRLDALL